MRWEIESVGLQDFELRFRAVAEFREDIVDTIEWAGRRAAMHAADHAPRDTGNLRAAVYHTQPKYMPGAGGGGGLYEVRVGVHETQAPYAEWLLRGTGIYGPHKTPIVPTTQKYMKFFWKKTGKTMFRKSVLGQPEQSEWWNDAQEMAQRLIRQRIQRI